MKIRRQQEQILQEKPIGTQTKHDYALSYTTEKKRERGISKKRKDALNASAAAALPSQDLKETPSQNKEETQKQADQDRRTRSTINVGRKQRRQAIQCREEEAKNKQQEQPQQTAAEEEEEEEKIPTEDQTSQGEAAERKN